MILQNQGEFIENDNVKLAIGDRIIAADSDYAGLKGWITEIRTGADKETENTTDDVYCRFEIPETAEKQQLLEEHFSALYGEKKTMDDLCLDMVIMAPEELRTVGEDE
ncbi:hypothetical protein [Ructibacterium gallinarum]|uniref:Uncharacterized protein n=1 Tax=Ructibacterium gallinarum TaxID=2779355 RepID=A0A9D5R9R7_9FIRM|nr:hypothetical protein [Ructibacterium gallinarum]MBE5040779.1 hypothetical protein [Ructibacterium gallinarum]